MMRLARFGLLGLLLAFGLPTSAAIYTYVDAEGNRVFTDRPADKAAEPVETRPSNRMAAQPVPPPRSRVEVVKVPVPGYTLLDIVQPEADATIRSNSGELAVSIASNPSLQPGHRYRLLLDGAPTAAPTENSQFVLINVDRGTHRMAVEVIDVSGKSLQSSAARSFHMLRTSLAQRRRINPCKQGEYGVRPECPLKDKPEDKKDIPFVPFL